MTQLDQPTINQNNDHGQNVAVQHVYQSVSSEHITPSVEGVMGLVRERRFIAAQEHVTALANLADKDIETTRLLPVLDVIISLASGHLKDGALREITQAINDIKNPTFLDIAKSASLRAEVLLGGINEAEELYRGIDYPGEFSQEVYFESIASNEKLEKRLSSSGIRQNEIALCSLARGLLFRGGIEQAEQAGKWLVDRFPSFNSNVVYLIIRLQAFGGNVSEAQYWLFKGSEFKRLSIIIGEAIKLMKDSRGEDSRIVELASKLLIITKFEHDELVNTCCKFLQFFERSNLDIFRCLSENSGIQNQEAISNRDIKIDSANEKLNHRKNLTLIEFVNFLHFKNQAKLKAWYLQGGRIASETEIENKFNEIHLLAFLGETVPSVELEINDLVNSFVELHSDQLSNIPTNQLNHAITWLMSRGLHAQAYLLLKDLIDPTDLWLSPLTKNYIEILLQANKQQTLSNVFLSLPEEDWDEFLWLCHSEHLRSLNDLPGALKSIENAININQDSKLAWSNLINLHRVCDTNAEEYSRVLLNVPDTIFDAPSEPVGSILFELLNKGFFPRAESILVKWFLNDPDAVSIMITNLSLGSVREVEPRPEQVPSMIAHGCVGAFRYIHGNNEFIKIVVSEIETKHECLIAEDSPIGKQLLSMAVGDSEMVHYKKMQLLEILPPYIACLKIAMVLREKNNDGTDCFYSISLPEAKEELIPFFEKVIFSGEDDKRKNNLGLLGNPDYPLFIKGKLLGDTCPVHTAANHLSSNEVCKLPFLDIGLEEPKCLLLDIYSVTYLGISGLIYGLIRSNPSLAITVETEAYLKQFMQDIHDPTYLRAGMLGGKFSRTTSADMLSQTKDLQVAINYVLESAVIPVPKAVDMPENIAFLDKGVDASVHSTMRLVVSNDLPWLCIDTMFAQLFQTEGYSVVNNHKYFIALGESASLEEKLPGLIAHSISSFPFTTTYKEFHELAGSQLLGANFALSKILLKHEGFNIDPESLLKFLTEITVSSLITAISGGQFQYGTRTDSPNNDGHAERIFNASALQAMRAREGMGLRNLAVFFLRVSYTHSQDKRLTNIVNNLAFSFMDGHFIPSSEVIDLMDEMAEKIHAQKQQK